MSPLSFVEVSLFGDPADTFDVSVAASIMDLNRNAVPQFIGLEAFPFAYGIEANPDDTTPPTVIDVMYDDTVNPQTIELTFSEVMDRFPAEDPLSYTWDDPGLTIAGAQLADDGITVTLELGPGQDAGGATLTVGAVIDINGNTLVDPCGPACGPLP